DLGKRQLWVRSSYRPALLPPDGNGERKRQAPTTPKSGKPRIVDLTPDALAVFRGWLERSELRGRDALVFPHPGHGGLLDPSTVSQRRFKAAMEAAGIPKNGPRN